MQPTNNFASGAQLLTPVSSPASDGCKTENCTFNRDVLSVMGPATCLKENS